MSFKPNLLKEAIDDARIMRQTALLKAGMPIPAPPEEVKLFVGKSLDAIRLWLCKVKDENSLLSLYGAADSFINKYRDVSFILNLLNKDSFKPYEFTGKLINLEIPEPMDFNDGYFVANISLDLSGFNHTDTAVIKNEMKTRGYFFLTGTVEGDVDKGKEFVPKTKTFRDIERHIISSIEFTGLQFYYELGNNLPIGKDCQILLPPEVPDIPF